MNMPAIYTRPQKADHRVKTLRREDMTLAFRRPGMALAASGRYREAIATHIRGSAGDRRAQPGDSAPRPRDLRLALEGAIRRAPSGAV
jgi:hypothetical protein